MKKWGIGVDSFINGSGVAKAEEYLLHTPVRTPDGLPSYAYVIIAADVKYGIHQLIESRHGNPFCYVDPLLFVQYTADRKKQVLNIFSDHASELDAVYDALKDERSQKTFRNVLLHRAVHRPELLWQVMEPHQYFGNDVIASAKGCFVDCGAYTGDTLRAFVAQLKGNDYRYYAFEPEQDNYIALCHYVTEQHLDRVRLFPVGLWEKETILRFLENDANDSLAWKLVESGDEAGARIRADSLDHVLHGTKTDYIKMDIEGSELRALEGAKICIGSWNPVLAISAYHQLDHLWSVPEKIMEMKPNCGLYYRHHSWNMADTVCYGV